MSKESGFFGSSGIKRFHIENLIKEIRGVKQLLGELVVGNKFESLIEQTSDTTKAVERLIEAQDCPQP